MVPPTLDAYLMRPVLEGLWQHHETFDGTYTGDDLLDAHEMLDIRSANRRLAEGSK